ncbi:hypothetical protein TNCT_68241 [Trichonephila clavata]|uniref:Uncharacterized protein n=1 Tax=Trichonephila clavata TaxID=2740835 RepID=A0A8X6KT02_TRICU|nr:hypothetical protein TNCT_68241 [Trichonephila clavata]
MCYFRKSPQVTIIFVAAEVTGGPLRSAARAELRVRETRKSDTEEQDRMLWISTAIYCSLRAFLKERRRVESWKKNGGVFRRGRIGCPSRESSGTESGRMV